MYITEIPEGLSALNTPGCAAAIWHRTPLPRFQSWIDALAPEQLPTVRIVLRPDRGRAALMALVQHGGAPDSTERPMLVDDAAALAGIFADVTHAPYVRRRMDVVTGNAGQAFDMDATTARLICTYRGTGTQYGTARDGGEPDRVFTVPTGAPILLCGKAWPATRRSGLLHRSPSIAGTDETRLVLVIDPIADLESEPDPKHTTVH